MRSGFTNRILSFSLSTFSVHRLDGTVYRKPCNTSLACFYAKKSSSANRFHQSCSDRSEVKDDSNYTVPSPGRAPDIKQFNICMKSRTGHCVDNVGGYACFVCVRTPTTLFTRHMRDTARCNMNHPEKQCTGSLETHSSLRILAHL